MDKTYNHKEAESRTRKFWEENNIYKFDSRSDKPIFIIDTPPPFTSGVPHMGHALWWTWNDLIARFKRMQGFNTLLPQGWDCHGLPTELQIEKKIKKENKREFLAACIEFSKESIHKMKSKMIE